jgi:DNA-binding PadR family transcriptional regulator
MGKDTELRLTGPTLKVLAFLLSVSKDDEISGVEIARATKLSSGTLYPILIRLEQARWAESRWEEGNPSELGRPRRRFYQLTALGAKKARSAIQEIAAPLRRLAWQ